MWAESKRLFLRKTKDEERFFDQYIQETGSRHILDTRMEMLMEDFYREDEDEYLRDFDPFGYDVLSIDEDGKPLFDRVSIDVVIRVFSKGWEILSEKSMQVTEENSD